MISIDFDPKESAKRSFVLEGFYPHKVVMRAPLRKLLGDDEKINFFSQRKIGYYCWRWPRKNTNKFFLHSSPRLTRVILLLWSAYFFKKRCRRRFLLLDSRRILKRCCRLFHTWIEKHPQQQNYPAMTWRKKVPIEIKATQKITIRRPFSILLSRG